VPQQFKEEHHSTSPEFSTDLFPKSADFPNPKKQATHKPYYPHVPPLIDHQKPSSTTHPFQNPHQKHEQKQQKPRIAPGPLPFKKTVQK
jgi:hypothetical protein